MIFIKNSLFNSKMLFKLILLLFTMALSVQAFSQGIECTTRPHYQRDVQINPNLIANGNFSSPSGWDYFSITSNGPISSNEMYNTTESYDANTGSILIDRVNSEVLRQTFSVPGEGIYTFSCKMKAENICPGPIVQLQISFLNGAGSSTGTSFAMSELDDPNTAMDEGWQESTAFINVPAGTTSCRVQMRKHIPTEGNATYKVYIDDVYFGAKRSFDNKGNTAGHEVCRKTFESSEIKIDALGNMEIYESGTWYPFFVFGMAGETGGTGPNDNYSSCSNRLSLYKNAGFNTLTRITSREQLECVVNQGMWGCYSLGPFVNDQNGNTPNNQMLAKLNSIFGQGTAEADLNDNLLYYYFDLETDDYRWWSPLANNIEAVQNLEIALYGERVHPQYILNGTFGIARQYNNQHLLDNNTPDAFGTDYQYENMLGDITGTYIVGKPDNSSTDFFKVLDNLEDQQMPPVIAQINVNDMSVRARLFGAIAHGAKGLNY